MNSQRVIFRADGNSEIGLGHVIRSLALADMLKDEFECVFATRFLTDYIKEEAKKSCAEVVKLSEESDSHLGEFLNCLSGDEIVVLDNYFFETDYQRKIKAKGSRLVCIDDMHDRHYVADAVVNHSVHDPVFFSAEPYTKLCLGFDYALLRNPFLQSHSLSEERERNSVLVCFGGADPHNLTQRVLEFLDSLKRAREVHLVVGGAYPHTDLLKRQVDSCQNVKAYIYSSLSADEMYALMRKTEKAVLPASTVILEALAAGMQVLGGYFVENQREFYDFLCRSGYINGIGDFLNADFEEKADLYLGMGHKNKPLIPVAQIKNNYLRLFKKMQKGV